MMGFLTVADWLQGAEQLLRDKGILTSRLDVENLMMLVLDFSDRTELVLRGEQQLLASQIAQLNNFLYRRANGEPLAYILGYKEFYGRRFLVDERVLIPRVESELIVDEVLKRARLGQARLEQAELGSGVLKRVDSERGHEGLKEVFGGQKIVDVGTGSGCLAISIKAELPEAEVVGLDVSEQALAVARENAVTHRVKVEFRQNDLLAGFENEQFDIIVANLPYVDRGWDWLGREIDFEPEMALFAEDRGLALIFRLMEQAKFCLKKDGALLLESDTCQQEEILKRGKKWGFKGKKVSDYVLLLTF